MSAQSWDRPWHIYKQRPRCANAKSMQVRPRTQNGLTVPASSAVLIFASALFFQFFCLSSISFFSSFSFPFPFCHISLFSFLLLFLLFISTFLFPLTYFFPFFNYFLVFSSFLFLITLLLLPCYASMNIFLFLFFPFHIPSFLLSCNYFVLSSILCSFSSSDLSLLRPAFLIFSTFPFSCQYFL